MKQHDIKTWMPFFQKILEGKKPFEFRFNDRNYKVNDEVTHHEYDPAKQEETGRTAYMVIVDILHGPQFGIPEGYCIFTQHNQYQQDFIRDFDQLSNTVLAEYEAKLTYKRGGSITERFRHVLHSFESAATDSIFKAKNFIDDTKTQLKALELMLEGITSDGLNHGQKRVIANHIITMIRSSVDKIDQIQWDYSEGMRERFNFYRSDSPEGTLLRKYREIKMENDSIKVEYAKLRKLVPEEKREELPF